jgi:solute carrier family 25 folate transporter 32
VWRFFVAGAGGGLVASIATCPLDVVKTKLQAQRAVQGQVGYQGTFGTFRSPDLPSSASSSSCCGRRRRIWEGKELTARSLACIETVKDILRQNGVRGLYRGLGPTILGYLPTWAIYFAVYDGIKTYFGSPPPGSSAHERERIYPAAQVKGYQPVMREHPWSLHILSAMTAGATSTICTNPLWVIKTRFMVRYFGALWCAKSSSEMFWCFRPNSPVKFVIGTHWTLPRRYTALKV